MKAPRVYVRGSKIYVEVYDPAAKKQRKIATGIDADIKPAAGDPLWWRKSKHAKRLKQFLAEVEVQRARRVIGTAPLPKGAPSVQQLLAYFKDARERKRDRPVSPRTVEHWQSAIDFLLRYDPEFYLEKLSPEYVDEFRAWGKKQLKPASLRTYWIDYRAIFGFAVDRDYIARNYFADLAIHVPQRVAKRIESDEEDRLFAFLYLKRRPLFYQTLWLRLTGIRVTDSTMAKVGHLDLKNRIYNYHNSKAGGRIEPFPLSDAAMLLVDWMDLPSDPNAFLLPYRTKKTVGYYLGRACEFTEIAHLSPHDLKRGYIQEVAKGRPDPRTFDLLAHHSPSINQVAVDSYGGRDLDLMRETIDVVQAHWIERLERYRTQQDDGKKYRFSNPKCDAGRPDRWKKKRSEDGEE